MKRLLAIFLACMLLCPCVLAEGTAAPRKMEGVVASGSFFLLKYTLETNSDLMKAIVGFSGARITKQELDTEFAGAMLADAYFIMPTEHGNSLADAIMERVDDIFAFSRVVMLKGSYKALANDEEPIVVLCYYEDAGLAVVVEFYYATKMGTCVCYENYTSADVDKLVGEYRFPYEKDVEEVRNSCVKYTAYAKSLLDMLIEYADK